MSLAEEVRTLRHRVAERLAELEPLVREYQELQEVAAELGIAEQRSDGAQPEDAKAAARPSPATTSSPRASSRSGGRTAKRGKSAVSSSRELKDAERVREAIHARPGATVADLATTLGIPATGLYRTVRDLTNAGAIVKRGRALYPQDGS